MYVIKNNLSCPCCQKTLSLVQKERGQEDVLLEGDFAKEVKAKWDIDFEFTKDVVKTMLSDPRYEDLRIEYKKAIANESEEAKWRRGGIEEIVEIDVEARIDSRFMTNKMTFFIRECLLA